MDIPKLIKEYWEVELAKQYATVTPFEKPKQEDIDFWLALIRSEHWNEICERADREKYLDEAGVVRCKDCKYKRLYDEGDTKYYYCALEDRPNRQWSVDDTDYCSWGERKE